VEVGDAGLDPDGLAQERVRGGEVPALVGEDTQEAERVGMLGIGGQRLPVERGRLGQRDSSPGSVASAE